MLDRLLLFIHSLWRHVNLNQALTIKTAHMYIIMCTYHVYISMCTTVYTMQCRAIFPLIVQTTTIAQMLFSGRWCGRGDSN